MDLEEIAERAPRAAGRIHEAVGWLERQQFPLMFRRLSERPNEHVLVVRPHAVFYVSERDTLTILRVVDSRRRVEPW